MPRYKCRGTNGFGSAEFLFQVTYTGQQSIYAGRLYLNIQGICFSLFMHALLVRIYSLCHNGKSGIGIEYTFLLPVPDVKLKNISFTWQIKNVFSEVSWNILYVKFFFFHVNALHIVTPWRGKSWGHLWWPKILETMGKVLIMFLFFLL